LKKKVEIGCNWKIKGTRTKKKKVEKFRDFINSIRDEIKKKCQNKVKIKNKKTKNELEESREIKELA